LENRILDKFKDTIKIKVSGKNIDRFIKRLYKNNIEILSLKNINRNTIIISIYLNDYNNVMRLKSIYEINDVGVSGLIKFKNYIYKNRFMIISIKNGYFVDATSGQRLTGRILGNSTLDTVDILRVKDGIPQRKYLYKWNSEKSGYRKVGSPVDIIYNADDVNKTVKYFRNLKQKNPSSLDNRTNIVTKQVGEVLNKVKNYVKSEEGQFDIITDLLTVLLGW